MGKPPLHDADIILVGAGLASACVVARFAAMPEPPAILILEKGPDPFADHTWSFHQADLSADAHRWIAPMIAHRWDGHSVSFRDFSRRIASAYYSLTSESVARYITRLPFTKISTGTAVEKLEPKRVILATGETLNAQCVIDARGFEPNDSLRLGFQKFVGWEIETTELHALTEPILMDATVPQLDGYRFVYTLPLSSTRLLIEDTRYSDTPALDPEDFETGIRAYAAANDWEIGTVVRKELGCLPIALAFDANAFWDSKPEEVATIGLRAALFHPTTGYSLPDAVIVANLIARQWPAEPVVLASAIRNHAVRQARNQAFYRLLNRMLFKAAEPDQRHWVMRRFYHLPQPLIENFYAGRTGLHEKARILTGRPPVPILRALRCLSEANFLKVQER